MADEELAFETVARLASLIERREVSPVALVEAYLTRIDRLNDRVHAYITVCRESALAEARTAEKEIASGRYRGPLHGVPIGLKDQFYTKGVRTTGGSRIHANLTPDEDATIVRRLKDAGAIVLGKHNMAEFAMGGTREHPYGNPRNPWDLERHPGHSSSGSGVAVSASMCAAAIGEDTGGSGRIPAAACGISAIRPTHGRISRHGTFPMSWSMDCASPMGRTAEDCALLLQAIAGHDPRDPTSSALPVPDYRSALRSDIGDMRVGVVRELVPPESADAGVRSAFAEGVRVFEKLAASVEEVSIPLIGAGRPDLRGHLRYRRRARALRFHSGAGARIRFRDEGAAHVGLARVRRSVQRGAAGSGPAAQPDDGGARRGGRLDLADVVRTAGHACG